MIDDESFENDSVRMFLTLKEIRGLLFNLTKLNNREVVV